MNITNFPTYEEIPDSTLQYLNQQKNESKDPKEIQEKEINKNE
jgi:hypothetical protein